ncbi:MAG TPA: S8 family serine peptidase, partial [Nannocystis sp.]
MKAVIPRIAAALPFVTILSTARADSYIVVLNPMDDDVVFAAEDLADLHGGRVGFVYRHAVRGFLAELTPDAAADLATHPDIAYIEPDALVELHAQTIPTGIQRVFAHTNPNLPIGKGTDEKVDVDVAVLDTGIDATHPDLNVVAQIDCTKPTEVAACIAGGPPGHGHGTHVAGTIAARDNGIGVVGVAPGARLWSVQVLDGDGKGKISWIVAGIDWVVEHGGIEVINMSLGAAGYWASMDDAVKRAVDRGVAFAVSAGNSADDASNYCPANLPDVMTVSALADFDGKPGGLTAPTTCGTAHQDDRLATFSNFGPAVEVAAPGVCILSTTRDNTYGFGSGTSMAAPHVAGALALLASKNPPKNRADVWALYNLVMDTGNYDYVKDADNIHEPLLDVGDPDFYGAPPPSSSPAPSPSPSPPPPSPAIALQVDAYKNKGNRFAKLTWSGTTVKSVDIKRGATVMTASNSGTYTDGPLPPQPGNSVTYQVC